MIFPRLNKFKEFKDYNTAIKAIIVIALIINIILAVALPNLIKLRYRITYERYARNYITGQLSDINVTSSINFSYVDKEKTDEKINTALKEYKPVYSYSYKDSNKVLDLLDSLIKNNKMGKTDVSRVFKENGYHTNLESIYTFKFLSKSEINLDLKIAKEISETLLVNGIFDSNDILSYKNIIVNNNIEQESDYKVLSSLSLVTTNKLRTVINKMLREYNLKAEDKNFITILLLDVLTANVYYDAFGSLKAKNDIINSVDQVKSHVKKGDVILQRDKIVSENDLQKLSYMVQNSKSKVSIVKLVGSLIFVILLTFVTFYFIIKNGNSSYRNGQYLSILLIINIIVQITTAAILIVFKDFDVSQSYTFFPVIATAILMYSVCDNYPSAMISSFLISSYLILLPGSNLVTFFYYFSICLVSIYFASHAKKRIDILTQWFVTTIVVMFISTIMNLYSNNTDKLFISLLGSFLSIQFSYVISYALLPMFERWFNLPTQFRLRELAYGESEILNKLAKVAKGTYNHVQIVSDLSYHAAKAINANALLTKVGSLYHDIGKIDHPEYFIENQEGTNLHDTIKPTLSTAIIKSHVKVGVEKGRDAKLPMEVLDIINEHHGNDTIKYFLNKAQKATIKEEIQEADFRYDSVPPSSKESAIVMLADCTEAGTRSLNKVSVRAYTRFIERLITSKIESQQLINSKLTLTDLDIIKTSFVESLIGRDHKRIEYPDQKEENDV